MVLILKNNKEVYKTVWGNKLGEDALNIGFHYIDKAIETEAPGDMLVTNRYAMLYIDNNTGRVQKIEIYAVARHLRTANEITQLIITFTFDKITGHTTHRDDIDYILNDISGIDIANQDLAASALRVWAKIIYDTFKEGDF